MVCRRRAAATELVQLTALTQALAPQAGEPVTPAARSGRSGYLCIARDCLQGAAQKHLSGGFKGPVAPTAAGLASTLHTLAEARVLMSLGLARRCGLLVHGVERVGALSQDPHIDAAIFAAADLSPRSLRRLNNAQSFVDAELLGRSTGLLQVGAVAILPGRLSLQAAYWFRVWYETRTERSKTTTHNAIGVAR